MILTTFFDFFCLTIGLNMPLMSNMKRYFCTLAVFAALVAFFISCEDNVRPVEEDHTYILLGGLNKNLDDNSSAVEVYFERDLEIYSDAEIKINALDINYNAIWHEYIFNADSASALPAGEYALNVKDSSWFNYTFRDTIPSDFAISDIALPENRVNAGGVSVQLIWDFSPNAEGYLVAVTQKDSAYIGEGWITFAESGFNQATILPDAFRLSGDLDTAWYYVYVYSFTGAPSFDLGLPVALPAGFIPNIDEQTIAGSFGTIVVSARDSIHVTLQAL
jgi:hypothetical protein